MFINELILFNVGVKCTQAAGVIVTVEITVNEKGKHYVIK